MPRLIAFKINVFSIELVLAFGSRKERSSALEATVVEDMRAKKTESRTDLCQGEKELDDGEPYRVLPGAGSSQSQRIFCKGSPDQIRFNNPETFHEAEIGRCKEKDNLNGLQSTSEFFNESNPEQDQTRAIEHGFQEQGYEPSTSSSGRRGIFRKHRNYCPPASSEFDEDWLTWRSRNWAQSGPVLTAKTARKRWPCLIFRAKFGATQAPYRCHSCNINTKAVKMANTRAIADCFLGPRHLYPPDWRQRIMTAKVTTTLQSEAKRGTNGPHKKLLLSQKSDIFDANPGRMERRNEGGPYKEQAGLQSEAKRGTNNPQKELLLTRSVSVETIRAQGDTASVGPPIHLSHKFPFWNFQITPQRYISSDVPTGPDGRPLHPCNDRVADEGNVGMSGALQPSLVKPWRTKFIEYGGHSGWHVQEPVREHPE
ncbi:hypothetical protein B0H13DRAFT_1850734 [Mycena leptocephala]|nr:hypothetical protein B0H13DRAFT_1850734 [Mycena leptocephala]